MQHAIAMPKPSNFSTSAVLLDSYQKTAEALRAARFRTAPQEISEAEYWEAFGALPPLKYHSLGGVDSFRMSEFYSGTSTYIYAHCEGRFWRFMDDAYMPTSEIVAKVRAAQGLAAWVKKD